MTAEVAILNRKAVVMAADSAITVPSNSAIYYTGSKIFDLSLSPPIAIMIYGSASFGSIPWGSVVNAYRRTPHISSSGTVQDHAASFIEYLSSIAGDVSTEWQQQFIRNVAQREIHQVSVRAIQAVSMQRSDREIEHLDMRENTITQITQRIQELRKADPIEELEDLTVEQAIQGAFQDWNEFLDKHYVHLISVDDSIRSETQTMVKAALMATNQPWSSGIVIAGFGVDQWFPSLSHYILDGIMIGKPWTRCLREVQISDTNPSAICPFAQEAMIHTFMQGVHPSSRFAIVSRAATHNQLLTDYFCEQLQTLLIPEPDKLFLIKEVKNVTSRFMDIFKKDIDNILKRYSDPIVATVASLPKERMATMAEGLVNLASLDVQVTPKDETVGGPVDVAMISKEDGLVWIKHKASNTINQLMPSKGGEVPWIKRLVKKIKYLAMNYSKRLALIRKRMSV